MDQDILDIKYNVDSMRPVTSVVGLPTTLAIDRGPLTASVKTKWTCIHPRGPGHQSVDSALYNSLTDVSPRQRRIQTSGWGG